MKRKMLGVLALALSLALLVGVAEAAKNTYTAHLSGPESKAQGQAIVKFSKNGESLSYKVTVANILNVTQAHIHVSPTPGGSGPPVLWLYPDAPPPQLIPGRTNGVLAEGTATEDDLVGPLAGNTLAALVEAIEEGRAYVNVHTSQFPPGEISGDLN